MSWPMQNTGPWNPGMMMGPDMNMGSYTPEQWAAMQQQNWQQWAQWQQQYAQWQSQYGDKYAQQMQAIQAVGGMPPLPPPDAVAPPAPPPPEKPPPPPHENNQPLYGHKPSELAPVPPPNVTQQNMNSNNNVNVNLIAIQTGKTNKHSQPQSTTVSSGNAEALKKLAEEERLFDIQFLKWEEEIEKWKKDNVNHPDKQAYKEYEEKFESCRAQLLERRQQMNKKKARLLESVPLPPQPTSTTVPTNINTPPQHFQNVPTFPNKQQHNYNSAISNKQQHFGSNPSTNYTAQSNTQYQNQSNTQYQNQQSFNMPPNKSNYNRSDIDSTDTKIKYQYSNNEEYSSDSFTAANSNPSFLLGSESNKKGIPGLDLVPDSDKILGTNSKQEVIDITGDKPVGPDYTTISKGINNILGDEKIMNILSMVRGQVAPDSTTNIPPIQTNQSGNYTGPNQSNSLYDQQYSNPNYSNQQFDSRQNNIPVITPAGNFVHQNNQNLRNPLLQNRNVEDQQNSMLKNHFDNYERNIQSNNSKTQYDREVPTGRPNMSSPKPLIRPLLQDMPGPNDYARDIKNSDQQNSHNFYRSSQGQGQQNVTDHPRRPQNEYSRGPGNHNDYSRGAPAPVSQNDYSRGPPPLMPQSDYSRAPPPLMPQSDYSRGPPAPVSQNDYSRGPPPSVSQNDYSRGPPPSVSQNDYSRGPPPSVSQNDYSRGPSGPEHQSDYPRGPPVSDHQNDYSRIPPGSGQHIVHDYPRGPGGAGIAGGPVERRLLPDNNIDSIASQPVRPKWVDEPMFSPSLIVEYEHKPLRLKARDFIEPVHMFDYNHKSKEGNDKKEFEKESEEIFIRKPRRSEKDIDYGGSRYNRDYSCRDFERRASREDMRDEYRTRVPSREDYDDRRRLDDDKRRFDDDRRRLDDNKGRFDTRFDDRRRDDRDKYMRRDDIYRDRERDNHRNRDRDRDSRRDNPRVRSRSRDKESRKRELNKENEVSDTVSKRSKDVDDVGSFEEPKHVVMIDDLLELPGREMRPDKIVIILRGPPGSGKSFLAKLIRDKEAEHGGTVRIMSIDDYFMQEGEIQEKDPTTGKMIKKPTLKYEYDEASEETYISSLKRAFKRCLTDGYFTFVIYDAVNDTLKSYADIWNLSRQNDFQVYICTMELDPQLCYKRNIHNRKLSDIEVISARFFPTPKHHIQLDATTLLQSGAITEVQMEDADDEVIMEDAQETEVESVFTSKWEKMDDAVKLARLDGTSKPLRPSQLSMEDYLQIDDWKPSTAKPGKKSVRWADIEERRQQEKMRAIGFVVGQTDWNRMTDPTMGSSALTQTKYIERVTRR